ncbi:hypothetical protein D3C73_731250 [compost metagenome]
MISAFMMTHQMLQIPSRFVTLTLVIRVLLLFPFSVLQESRYLFWIIILIRNLLKTTGAVK